MEGRMKSLKFTWIIKNFSGLNPKGDFSKNFVIGESKWRILIFRRGEKFSGTRLGLYLEVADASTLPSGWTRYAQFSLTVVNQHCNEKTLTIGTDQQEFNELKFHRGFPCFMALSKLYDPEEGYIVNDMCIVEATVAVPEVKPKTRKDQTTRSIASPIDVRVQLQSLANLSVVNKVGEFVDFRGFGKIDKTFVPLLDEVCFWRPRLIECQKNRSRMFAECAFTALGRVLHFLRITKVKDMTEDASEKLQLFWEELKTFGFDLTWLEPHVQSALGAVEKIRQVHILREDVAALEIERKRLNASVAITKKNLEVARIDLAKAVHFGETYMESARL